MSFDDFFRAIGKNARTTDTSFYDKTFPKEITKALPYGDKYTGPGSRITERPIKALDGFRRMIIPREVRKATPYDSKLKDPDVINGIAGVVAGIIGGGYAAGALGGGGSGGAAGTTAASSSAGAGAASGSGAGAAAGTGAAGSGAAGAGAAASSGGGGSAGTAAGGAGAGTGAGTAGGGSGGSTGGSGAPVSKAGFDWGSVIQGGAGIFNQQSTNNSNEEIAKKEREAREAENQRDRDFREAESRKQEQFQAAQNREARIFQLRQAEVEARQRAIEAENQGARDQALLVAQSLKEEREAAQNDQQAFAALVASLK